MEKFFFFSNNKVGGDFIKNYGYQNELDFVNLFNAKYLRELDENSQTFLKELFGDIMDYTEKIICWKNRMNQKADIFIKYKNYIKSVSLKCGQSNSIHAEGLQYFKLYLEKLGIPYKIIDKYIDYHYGYMRGADGKKDFDIPLNSWEYKELYQCEIDEFNDYINKTKIIVDMIDRFLVRGKNSDYDIDALVCGTTNDYVWVLKYDIYDLILSNRRKDLTSPHVACMTLGPRKRDLNRISKNKEDRYIVCVRWNYIRENIIEYKNNKTIS